MKTFNFPNTFQTYLVYCIPCFRTVLRNRGVRFRWVTMSKCGTWEGVAGSLVLLDLTSIGWS